jgi:predicted transcriptional regulator
MKHSTHEKIRQTLREFKDGLSVKEISDETGMPKSNLRKALKRMPDTYIDRWYEATGVGKGKYGSVWCIVVPPEDCPRPSNKREKE